jgi:phosphate starvation-inducible PhoH-like protein
LKNIRDISVVQFDVKDIVRHRLVRDIVAAYDKYQAQQLAKKELLNSDKIEENE